MAADTGLAALRISYAKDKRVVPGIDKKNGVTTHNSQFVRMSTKGGIEIVNSLSEVNVDEYLVIGVDEGQFYPDLVKIVTSWVNNGKLVYISSLDSDSDGNLFGDITKLLPISSSFKKLTARCVFCLEEGHVVEAIITASLHKKDSQVLVAGLK